jgi:hypothetical protein
MFGHDIPTSARNIAQDALERWKPDPFSEEAKLGVGFTKYAIGETKVAEFWADSSPDTSFMFNMCFIFLVENQNDCEGVIHICRFTPDHASRTLRAWGSVAEGVAGLDSTSMVSLKPAGRDRAPTPLCEVRGLVERYSRTDGYSIVYLEAPKLRRFLVRDDGGRVYVVTDTKDLIPYSEVRAKQNGYYNSRSN